MPCIRLVYNTLVRCILHHGASLSEEVDYMYSCGNSNLKNRLKLKLRMRFSKTEKPIVVLHIVTTIGSETGLLLLSNASNLCTSTLRTSTRVHTRSERNIVQRFCACVIVEIEHEYIRNVNVQTA